MSWRVSFHGVETLCPASFGQIHPRFDARLPRRRPMLERSTTCTGLSIETDMRPPKVVTIALLGSARRSKQEPPGQFGPHRTRMRTCEGQPSRRRSGILRSQRVPSRARPLHGRIQANIGPTSGRCWSKSPGPKSAMLPMPTELDRCSGALCP